MCCREGLEDMVVLLLKFGANIHSQSTSGLTALSHAAAKGHLNIVKLLCDNGAQVRSLNQPQTAQCHKTESHQFQILPSEIDINKISSLSGCSNG